MAKLTGTYKFVVASVDVGRNAKGNDVIKLGLTFTDERLNDQDVPLSPQPTVPWHGSLKRQKGPSGKSAAEVTIETIRSVFGFTGGLNDLHNLMFGQGYAVCEDHDAGNFTRISRIYGLNATPGKAGAALTEFTDDVTSELNALFNSK